MADSLNLRKTLGVSRAGQLVAATYSGATNTTLPGNLTVQGVLSNNVSGSLLLRAYDETGVFSAVTNVTGNPLPAAFSGRPVSALQTSSVNYTNATFSGLSQGYSLRISGYVKPPTTGTTTFRLTCQDGGRLFVGLGKLLNTWTFLSSSYVGTATVAMTAGAWLPITIEHSASTATEKLLLEFSLDGTTFNTFTHGTTSGAFQFMYDSAEAGPSQLGTNYVTGKAYHNDIAYFNQGLSLPNAAIVTGNLSELTNDVGYVTPQSTITGTALNITGPYASVTGNLVASTVTVTTTLIATTASLSGTLSALNLVGQYASLTGNTFIGGKIYNNQVSQGFGNYSSFSTAANVTLTAAQMIGGYIVSNAQSNGSYYIYAPTAALLYAACGNIVGATFTAYLYPLYSVTLTAGTGGSVYGGTLGNSGGGFEAYTGYNQSQGGSSLFLPNSRTYTISVVITSATAYVMFVV